MNHYTQRLILTPLTLDDVQAVYNLTSDCEVAKYMRFDTHYEINQAYELITEYINYKTTHAYSIRQKCDNQFVGIFVLKKSEHNDDEYDMSTFTGKEFWGKGFIQEILTFIKQYAKQALHASALLAYVVADNIASCTALIKRGFYIDFIIPIDIPCGLNVFRLNLLEENKNAR